MEGVTIESWYQYYPLWFWCGQSLGIHGQWEFWREWIKLSHHL